MSMTIDEFFEKLAETREEIEWRIEDKVIRAHNRAQLLCPITAVCYNVTGTYHSIAWYDEAARAMGLSLTDANIIAETADYSVDRDLVLYTKLIETLQL